MNKTVLPKTNKYSRYLCSCNETSNVELMDTKDIKFDLDVRGERYSLMFSCLSDYKLPIVFLCNPEKGMHRKPHQLHLRKANLIYLCLSIRDDISVRNNDYTKIIDYALERITKLLLMSESDERREFRKEFLYFWNGVSKNTERIKLYLNSSTIAKRLDIVSKKESYLITDSQVILNSFAKEHCKATTIDTLYIPFINNGTILPPFNEKLWTLDTLKHIMNYCISESNVDLLEQINLVSDTIMLVFEMYLPDMLPITYVLKLSCRNKKRGHIYERLHYISGLEHISSQRCDTEYLFKRIGMDNINCGKKVLFVGAGSLGSYILSELPQMGITAITLYDNDELSIENIMRHRLGSFYDGFNKARAMKYQLEHWFPQLTVDARSIKFGDSNIKINQLNDYDLIIIATGGTDYMLHLNSIFKESKISTPILFTWIEPNGVGVHALHIDYNKQGCFQCLYTNTNSNKAHFNNNQSNNVKLLGTGCGGVFNSYGNLTLLKGSTMILEVIQASLAGRLEQDKNQLHSIRTVNSSDKEYIISKRDWENTKDFYISKECKICGEKI